MLKRNQLCLFILGMMLSVGSYARADNPCDDIAGTWQGRWEIYSPYYCVWDAYAEAAKYGDLVHIKVNTVNGHSQSGHCIDSTFVISGECINGRLFLNVGATQLRGTVFNNLIDLSDPYNRAYLERKSSSNG